MKPRILACSTAAFLTLLGCQNNWQGGMMGSDPHEGVGPPKPDISEVEPEPEPAILPNTYVAAGELAQSRGDLVTAVSMYRKAIAVSKECMDAHNRLGLLLCRLGQHGQAEESFRRAVELAPDKAHLHNNLAYSLILQRKWKEAEAQLNQAVEIQPDFARARINLGVVLARTGRYEEAMKQFLLVLPPPSAHYNLGVMYEMNRQFELASACFSQALALNPNLTPAREGLKRMAAQLDAKAVARDDARLAQASDGAEEASSGATTLPMGEADLAKTVIKERPAPKSPSVDEAVEVEAPNPAEQANAVLEPTPIEIPAVPEVSQEAAPRERRAPTLEAPVEPSKPLVPMHPSPAKAAPAKKPKLQAKAEKRSATTRPVCKTEPRAEPSRVPAATAARMSAKPRGKAQQPTADATAKTVAGLVGIASTWWSGKKAESVRARLGDQFTQEHSEPAQMRSAEAPPLLLPDEGFNSAEATAARRGRAPSKNARYLSNETNDPIR